MSKFMLLYVAPSSAQEQMNVSPEQMQKVGEQWGMWYAKVGKEIVDPGAAFIDREAEVGIATKRKFHLGGYSIVQADNTEKVKALLDGHPHLLVPGASIQILELSPM